DRTLWGARKASSRVVQNEAKFFRHPRLMPFVFFLILSLSKDAPSVLQPSITPPLESESAAAGAARRSFSHRAARLARRSNRRDRRHSRRAATRTVRAG